MGAKDRIATSMAWLLLLATQVAVGGSITDSVHDFRSRHWGGERICIVCHTPTRPEAGGAEVPQWKFDGSGGTGYSVYGSPPSGAPRVRPGANSRLCLSCHDGTLATDRSESSVGATLVAPARDVESTLLNHHPIGIRYDKAVAAAGGALFDPAAKTVTIGSGEQSRTGTVASLLVFAGKIECLSCHDVHNTFAVGKTRLLKAPSDGRAICVACHDK